MIVKIVIGLLSILLAVGLLLKLLREDLLLTYFKIIGSLIALPFVLAIMTLWAVFGIFRLIRGLLGISLLALAKSAIFLIAVIPLAFIILVSYFVPHIGGGVLKIDSWVRENLDFSAFVEETRYSRRMMVEILAEEDRQELEYTDESEYREEFAQVKERGERRLSIGESVLSVCIGGILLASQVFDFSLFEASIYGVSATIIIQIALLVITVSILYRVPILSFLTFNGDEEFSSLQEWDVALAYQKAVSRVGIVQFLILMVVLAMRLMSADRTTIRKALNVQHKEGFLDSMKTGWREIRESRKENNDD